MTCHELEEELPLEDPVVANVEAHEVIKFFIMV
jgi:hypothetical protein